MLGSLSGVVTTHLDQRILVEVQGVGYWVHTGSWHPDGEVTCYLHHHIREDASDLYGFPDLKTLTLFEQLISVSGVGPKIALAILSIGTTERVIEGIHQNDTAFLAMAPGIGTKAAQKIILELKNKVQPPDGTPGAAAVHDDILSALESLGYRSADVQPYIGKLPPDHTTLDSQIRWVLQQIGKRSK